MPTETRGQGTGDGEGCSRVAGAFWGLCSICRPYLDWAWALSPVLKTDTQKPSFPSQCCRLRKTAGAKVAHHPPLCILGQLLSCPSHFCLGSL